MKQKRAKITGALAILLSLGLLIAIPLPTAEAAPVTAAAPKCNFIQLLFGCKEPVPAPPVGTTPPVTQAPRPKCNFIQLLFGCKEPAPTPPVEPTPTPPVETTPPVNPSPVTPPVSSNPFVDAKGCGPVVAKKTGGNWDCTFADNFDGTDLDRTKWIAQAYGTVLGPQPNSACYSDSPNVINVSKGTLKLNLVKLDKPAPCGSIFGATTKYAAGWVSTYGLWSQSYGRFEARYKSTAAENYGPDKNGIDLGVTGLHEAFWLYPDVRNGKAYANKDEIDIVETYSSRPSLGIPFLHYNGDKAGVAYGLNTAYDCMAPRGKYNTYTLEWTPKQTEIFVNGKSCLVNTSQDPAFKKEYIIGLTQAPGQPGQELIPGKTPVPATMQIDYVKAWK